MYIEATHLPRRKEYQNTDHNIKKQKIAGSRNNNFYAYVDLKKRKMVLIEKIPRWSFLAARILLSQAVMVRCLFFSITINFTF